jgi:hypothetical protein
MPQANLTERQAKWFESVRLSLERDTGKTLAEWIEIARTCPETAHRARLKWFKETHGLLQNRASQVLGEAFPSAMNWSEPEGLIDALWSDPASRAIYEAVDARVKALEGTVRTARKGYTAWSRRGPFAAARPIKGGKAMLGLAVPPDSAADLAPRRSESWSERLTSRIEVASPEAVTEAITAALRAAWEQA